MTRMDTATRLLSAILLLVLAVTACQKETRHKNKQKPFKVQVDTWCRVSPTAPTPVVVNGEAFVGFAHFPGGGEGNATHMGNVKNYFNPLAYTNAPEAPPLGSVAAPVADIPSYPVLEGPLPLIQSADFAPLPSLINSLNIPASLQAQIINSVLYNDKGDAVFTAAITGIGGTFPFSATIVGFNGKANIVGGRGKFAGASGVIDYSGYFNTADANDAEYNAEGWIIH